MRRLWPPNYDLLSAAAWALTASLLLNVIMILVAFRHDTWFWLAYPGMFGAMAATGKGFENSDGLFWPIAFWVTNIIFYYFVAWPLIAAFPAGRIRRSAKGDQGQTRQ